MSKLSEHFDLDEFKCKCGRPECHSLRVNPELINKLEQLRSKLGNKPIHINSGYRCDKHNREVGGVANSRHLYGMAADIVISGISPIDVALIAKEVGFTGIGVYDTFTHVDVRTGFAYWDNRTLK